MYIIHRARYFSNCEAGYMMVERRLCRSLISFIRLEALIALNMIIDHTNSPQSLFALGSIFFQKHPVAKTFIAVMLIATVYYFIGYGTYRIFDSGYWYSGMISGEPSMGLLWCLVIFGCIINYALSYWRFRESEIIQRW